MQVKLNTNAVQMQNEFDRYTEYACNTKQYQVCLHQKTELEGNQVPTKVKLLTNNPY